jgi:hypothetical protein
MVGVISGFNPLSVKKLDLPNFGQTTSPPLRWHVDHDHRPGVDIIFPGGE